MDNAIIKGFAFRTEHFFTGEVVREKLKKEKESEPDRYHYFIEIRLLNPIGNTVELKRIRFKDVETAQIALEDLISDMNTPALPYPLDEEEGDGEEGDDFAEDEEELEEAEIPAATTEKKK